MENKEKLICPYCKEILRKWANPEGTNWNSQYQYVCFNDDCSYYKNGWKWMLKKYEAKASYRHRYNPVNGETGPLPVWSENALKDNIID